MDDLNSDLLLKIASHLDVFSAIRLSLTTRFVRDALKESYPHIKQLLCCKNSNLHSENPRESSELFFYAWSIQTSNDMERWSKCANETSNEKLYRAIRFSVLRELQLIPRYTSSKFQLTSEQRRPLRFGRKHEAILVQAFAGTGKTAMMVEFAKQYEVPILYVAYNKALATESQKRFSTCKHVTVSTMHAFALNRVSSPHQLGELSVDDVQNFFSNISIDKAYEYLRSFTKYCSSSEITCSNEHVNALWDAMFKNQTLPVTHDAYLKQFQLMQVRQTEYDIILVDEVQDFTDCMLDIICKIDGTKVFVGDVFQKIYGFKNVTDPYKFIVNHVTNLRKFSLTRTFRFGHDLAIFVNTFLQYKFHTTGFKAYAQFNTELRPMTSYEEIPSDSVVVTRFNLTLYQVMFRLSNMGRRFHVKGDSIDVKLEIESIQFLIHFTNSEKFQSVDDFFEYVYAVKDNSWMLRVSLFLKYGSAIIDMLKKVSLFLTENEGIGLITAHRSKGLEFEHVVLTDDFGINSPDECNVTYVALTRAIRTIYIPTLLINYVFQKHPKLRFSGEAMHGRCMMCKRNRRIRTMHIEDDPEVVLNNRCEIYYQQSICEQCIKY